MTDDQTRAYDNEAPVPDQVPGQAPDQVPGQAPGRPSPTEAPAAAGPVADTSAARGPNRARLLAALAVAGIVLALTAGGLLFLGGSTTPEALKYIPADMAFVAEVRMDLPGDQMQKLGNFLAKFPGFADQSTLPEKIDEAFGQFIRNASGGSTDYVTDIKPWLNGPAFIAVSSDSIKDDDPSSALISSTTNGAVTCAALFEGQTTTQETHNGLALTLAGNGATACVVDGRFALAGDPASVRKGLDAKAAGNGMDKSSTYTAARRQLTGEQLATFYVNGAAVKAITPAAAPSLPIPGFESFAGQVPDWIVMGLRAEDDAMVLDVVAAPIPASSAAPSLLPAPAGHASALIGLVPADTLLYVEHQGTGVALQNTLTILRSVPELQAPLEMLDGVVRAEDLVGWVEDAAIAVSAEGADIEHLQPHVTVLLAAADAASATERVSTVKALLGLLALRGGVTLTDTEVGGVTVTTVTIADLGAIVPQVPVSGLGELPAGEITFSIAARDRVVYLAVGEGTIAKVLGLAAGANLADSVPFKQAAARGLANSGTTMYVAAGAAVDLVEPFLPDDVSTMWTTDVQPYVAPIQAIGAWSSSDASGTRFRTVITVAAP